MKSMNEFGVKVVTCDEHDLNIKVVYTKWFSTSHDAQEYYERIRVWSLEASLVSPSLRLVNIQ